MMCWSCQNLSRSEACSAREGLTRLGRASLLPSSWTSQHELTIFARIWSERQRSLKPYKQRRRQRRKRKIQWGRFCMLSAIWRKPAQPLPFLQWNHFWRTTLPKSKCHGQQHMQSEQINWLFWKQSLQIDPVKTGPQHWRHQHKQIQRHPRQCQGAAKWTADFLPWSYVSAVHKAVSTFSTIFAQRTTLESFAIAVTAKLLLLTWQNSVKVITLLDLGTCSVAMESTQSV